MRDNIIEKFYEMRLEIEAELSVLMNDKIKGMQSSKLQINEYKNGGNLVNKKCAENVSNKRKAKSNGRVNDMNNSCNIDEDVDILLDNYEGDKANVKNLNERVEKTLGLGKRNPNRKFTNKKKENLFENQNQEESVEKKKGKCNEVFGLNNRKSKNVKENKLEDKEKKKQNLNDNLYRNSSNKKRIGKNLKETMSVKENNIKDESEKNRNMNMHGYINDNKTMNKKIKILKKLGMIIKLNSKMKK
ncbi:hypothetical protein EDEG_02136 [Edhazardia aedis USNM 41457]|uniref:Uncharacterized protein n=1 Tax=Edhazardia aedis (strain USNM 41457) TaxID=1003232 RepID=J9DQG8_EDHAE|nr:hypothetical protein EDEG_02136 [Edhazardia aedis USNM 41457]|eukprot:EJW03552.1 hypothetical protein EDEG_02136 [Edhazardia aedis USNM 41457]